MPFYTGKTADGSDMTEVQGIAYMHPNEKEWSSTPYPKSVYRKHNDTEEKRTERESRLYWAIYDHITGKRTFRDEYVLVLEKKSTLSKAQREYLINMFENK